MCVTGPETHGKAIAGSADRCQHTPALRLQEDGAILHGWREYFGTGGGDCVCRDPSSQPLEHGRRDLLGSGEC